MSARDLAALIRDLRAVGIPYEPDLTWSPPVRHRSALYVALGHLVEREARDRSDLCGLYRRTLASLAWIRALGARSRWAGWFREAA